MGAPSWMGGGAYEKNPGWYRSPQVGGGLQWSPEYGFQRKQTIAAGIASGKPMDQWGMKKQLGTDFKQYYPGARTDAELIKMGLAGKGNTGYKAYQTAGGWYDYSKAPGQPAPTPGPPNPVPNPVPNPTTVAVPTAAPVAAPAAAPVTYDPYSHMASANPIQGLQQSGVLSSRYGDLSKRYQSQGY